MGGFAEEYGCIFRSNGRCKEQENLKKLGVSGW